MPANLPLYYEGRLRNDTIQELILIQTLEDLQELRIMTEHFKVGEMMSYRRESAQQVFERCRLYYSTSRA